MRGGAGSAHRGDGGGRYGTPMPPPVRLCVLGCSPPPERRKLADAKAQLRCFAWRRCSPDTRWTRSCGRWRGCSTYDLDERLASMVALEARIPEDAYSARTLSTERVGNAIVIGDRRPDADHRLPGHRGRGGDRHHQRRGGASRRTCWASTRRPALACCMRWSRWGCRRCRSAIRARCGREAAVISAGAGGRSHALSGRILAREPFAGYWEYYLDAALYVEPAHPHWNGAALIGPTGDLIGVGSLKMEQVVEGERGRAAQHVRAGRAAAADPRRPQPRPPGAAAAALARRALPRDFLARGGRRRLGGRPGLARRAAPAATSSTASPASG